jgi:hypothetical protein
LEQALRKTGKSPVFLLNLRKLFQKLKFWNSLSYKMFMKANANYMQNRHVHEGRLFTNFIAMTACCKLYSKLRETKPLGKYSLQDIASRHYRDEQGDIQGEDTGVMASCRGYRQGQKAAHQGQNRLPKLGGVRG